MIYESVTNSMYVEMDSSTFGQRDGFLAQVSVIIDGNTSPVQETAHDHVH